MSEPMSDELLEWFQKSRANGTLSDASEVLLAEVERIRAQLAAAQANPVLRYLQAAHPHVRTIDRDDHAEKPGERWAAWTSADREMPWALGPTPEAACAAALKTLEGGDDGE